jgi:hypothetical protein
MNQEIREPTPFVGIALLRKEPPLAGFSAFQRQIASLSGNNTPDFHTSDSYWKLTS